MKERRWRQAAFLLFGLAFALLGQFYFVYRRDPYYRDGIIFYAVALAMFGAMWWRMRSPKPVPAQAPEGSCIERFPLRLVAAIGGGALSLFAGFAARRRPMGSGFAGLLVLWLLGVVWFVAAFAPAPPRDWWQRLVAWLRSNRGELLRLAALLVVALFVRSVALGTAPRNFGGDEGTQALAALRLVERPSDNPFSTGWYSVPTMSFLVSGVAMRIFGATVAGARALSALAGTGAVLATYLLARDLWGRRVGWLAAFLLAFGHYHLHFSRLASNQIGDSLFITLALWLLMRGLRSGDRWFFALAGAVTGAAWYGYFGGRLTVIVMATYFLVRVALQRDFFKLHWRELVLMTLAAVVVALPLMLHYLAYPDTMTSRFNQVSIFASGWLAREQEITGRGAVSLLLEQFWKAALAFHYTVDPTFWYRPGIPLLDFVSGVLMLFGIGVAILRKRWRSDGLLLLWFWLAIILGWVMTENPPSSQRMPIAAPAVAVLVALGADWLIKLVRRLLGGRPAQWARVLAAVIGLIAILNLSFYFFDYVPTRVYGNPTAEIAAVLCDDLQAREDVPPVYFVGMPYMYWDFGAIAFRLRDVEGYNYEPDQSEFEPQLDDGALFIILELRLDDLASIVERYPGGEVQYVYSEVDDRLLFLMYEVRSWRE